LGAAKIETECQRVSAVTTTLSLQRGIEFARGSRWVAWGIENKNAKTTPCTVERLKVGLRAATPDRHLMHRAK
jgi:hypothetical protein